MSVFFVPLSAELNTAILANEKTTIFGTRRFPYFFHVIGRCCSKIFDAIRFYKPFMMHGSMGLSCYDNKIFGTIVRFYTINMVDNLILSDGSPQARCHYKNTFTDISALISIWMIWFANIRISIFCCIFSVIPVCIKVSAKLMTTHVRFRETFEGIFVPVSGLSTPTGTLDGDWF